MREAPTDLRWSAPPQLLQSLRRWSWCREALATLLARLGSELSAVPVVDTAALARAFWQWAATLDSEARLEALDRVDHAHFQVGMLLSQLLWQRPLPLPGDDRSDEVGVYTDLALTLLAAWLEALGAPLLEYELPERASARWASYVENVSEDPLVAVAFLDLFTGREPVWRFPAFPTERPAVRHALEERRRTMA